MYRKYKKEKDTESTQVIPLQNLEEMSAPTKNRLQRRNPPPKGSPFAKIIVGGTFLEDDLLTRLSSTAIESNAFFSFHYHR